MELPLNFVLSGGGSRGFAHIGVLQAFEEMGIVPAAISGASAGSLIGALLCDGYSAAEIRAEIERQEPGVNLNFRSPRSGLLTFSGVEALLKRLLRAKKFEDLRKPLYVSVTNLHTAKQEVLDRGELIPALSASSALPMLFPAVEIQGIPCADAGMSNNLPVEPFIGKPGKIIGVHVNPLMPYKAQAKLTEVIDRSMHIIVGNTTRPAASVCDVFIEPPDLVRFGILERKKAKEIISVGYDYVKAHFSPQSLLSQS